MAADRPCGDFYDVYSVSPEYIGFHHVRVQACWSEECTDDELQLQRIQPQILLPLNFICVASIK
jgi:hypothetical protein